MHTIPSQNIVSHFKDKAKYSDYPFLSLLLLHTIHSHFLLEYVHVLPELRDGVPGQVKLEGELADLVGDESGHRLDLVDVGVGGADLHQQAVGLAIVLVGRVQIALQLVQEAGLELVTHEQRQVRRLVQVLAVALHVANLLRGGKKEGGRG